MKLITYVNFAGKCAEAFRYYEQHLGAKIGMMMTHGQNPAPSPYTTGEWKDAVLHARIAIGGTELAGADVPKAEPMRSAYLTLNTESDSEASASFRHFPTEAKCSCRCRRLSLLRDSVNFVIVSGSTG